MKIYVDIIANETKFQGEKIHKQKKSHPSPSDDRMLEFFFRK